MPNYEYRDVHAMCHLAVSISHTSKGFLAHGRVGGAIDVAFTKRNFAKVAILLGSSGSSVRGVEEGGHADPTGSGGAVDHTQSSVPTAQ
jgi:hypothetical protein